LEQAGVGRALAASDVPRNELFIATKVWTDCLGAGPKAVLASVAKSMVLLQVIISHSQRSKKISTVASFCSFPLFV
jgi:diketogulonate reductase-like aldo/keto reductase